MDEQKKIPPSVGEEKTSSDSSTPFSEESPKNPPFKGLCINCENRHTCVLPRPAGGVWHCEEYL